MVSGMIRSIGALLALAIPAPGLLIASPAIAATGIQSMGYQLQLEGPREAAVDRIAAAPHDLIVIDYSMDGTRERRFTRDEVARMQEGPDGRRLVASYISIGEASDFRGHPIWDPAWTTTGRAVGDLTPRAPDWLGPVNPNWPESRKVRFWDRDWQRRIFDGDGGGWLDSIVAQGFDAAYLDIVLAYYYWHDHEGHDVRWTARAMIEFIVEMTAHARATNPDFFMIPQNGAWIVNDAGLADVGPGDPDWPLKRDFMDSIGAFGAESVYFPGPRDENNPFDPVSHRIERLQRDFLCNGKHVVVIEYVNRPEAIERLEERASADGFAVCAAPDRGLRTMCPVPNRSPEPPDCG